MAGYQTGANSFSLDLAKFARKTDVNMVKLVQKISAEAFKRIIWRTPVDTGRARANWGVSVGAPKPPVIIIDDDKEGDRTLTEAIQKVKSFNADGSIFMCNNVPYIMGLEHGTGSPKQAPQGMVKITVEEITGFISKATIESIKGQTS